MSKRNSNIGIVITKKQTETPQNALIEMILTGVVVEGYEITKTCRNNHGINGLTLRHINASKACVFCKRNSNENRKVKSRNSAHSKDDLDNKRKNHKKALDLQEEIELNRVDEYFL